MIYKTYLSILLFKLIIILCSEVNVNKTVSKNRQCYIFR